MKKFPLVVASGLLAAAMLSFAACAPAESDDPDNSSDGELTPVTLQLKWLRQSQFMGYYAADVLGFYEEEGLDVTIVEGGTTSEIDAVESGNAQFGTTWVSNLLPSIANGSSLMAIAQFYQDSGMTIVSMKETQGEETEVEAGESVGNWLGGNQYELQAYLASLGLDTELTSQSYDMNQLLTGELHWASAMTYNELGLVLEEGYDLDELNVIYMRDTDVAMMEDCLFVDSEWAAANQDTVRAFLRASIKGWAWACTHADPAEMGVAGNDTGALVYEAGDSVSLYHQQYMASEVAKLVVDGTTVTESNLNAIGTMVEREFNTTRDILSQYYTSSTASTTPSSTDLATQEAIGNLTFSQVFYTAFWEEVHDEVDLSDLDSYVFGS